MNALHLMADAAAQFRARLSQEAGCRTLSVPHFDTNGQDLRWDNLLLSANRFRRAHVETLLVPGTVCVLHVCIFPHLDDPSPIYGFDMIAGAARVTGIFLDLTPVSPQRPGLRLRDAVKPFCLDNFSIHRKLPDWGDIFSPDVLAVRPMDLAEVVRAIDLAKRALDASLAIPQGHRAPPSAVAAGQAAYVAGQRRNDHTRRMLAGWIGNEQADRFIDEVLFPSVPAEALVA